MPHFLLRRRKPLLILFILLTLGACFLLPKVEKSYDYVSAIPRKSEAAADYDFFKKTFPTQGSYIVLGIQSTHFFTPSFFSHFATLNEQILRIPGVENILSVQQALRLVKDEERAKFTAIPLFAPPLNDSTLQAGTDFLRQLPLYQGLLYNPNTHTYLVLINIANDYVFSKKREALVRAIEQAVEVFHAATKTEVKISGIPYIRTKIADIISHEMLLLIGAALSFLLLIIGFAFRSFSHILITLLILISGVVFTFATLVLLGYKISLLTAIIPTLIIIIGVPNCVYFFHKYATAYEKIGTKEGAIRAMLATMGPITLFCNLTAALGFFVFIFTSSTLLHEFSLVASLNILLLFGVSYLLIPILLSYFPAPSRKKQFLNTPRFNQFLLRLERFTFSRRKAIGVLTLLTIGFSFLGILRLEKDSFVLDDLPKSHVLYQDLHFFESHFKGVLPLEILIDTKKKRAATNLAFLTQVDSFSQYLARFPALSAPLSLVDGLKFMRQMYYNGGREFYGLPNAFDLSFLAPYLKRDPQNTQENKTLSSILNTFTDRQQSVLRLSLRIADIGQKKTEKLLAEIKSQIPRYIDTSLYQVRITGDTLAFLAGNTYLLSGLQESILWAIGFIVLIMLYLFRSLRIILVSLIPNLIPLALSLGLLGWFSVPIRPSLVIIFSITLGIAIDITIRIMMHYKIFFSRYSDPEKSMHLTLQETGTSLIYTSLILMGGFLIFTLSQFESIRYLGLITTFTLLTATFSNLLLLPSLLRIFNTSKK